MTRDIYKQFIHELNVSLSDVVRGDANLYLNTLVRHEEKFKKILISRKKGRQIYQEFIEFIRDEIGDIRDAKVYFREREEVVSKQLPTLFRKNKIDELIRYKINYKFMKWVVGRDCPRKKELEGVFGKVIDLRKRIIVENLPLVVNQSRIFQVKSKKYNMDYSDIMQIATEGFMDAIDKFVPPSNFISVATGRMTSKMMAESMEGQLKLSSEEKKVLYRANIAIYRLKITDFRKVLSFVRESFPKVTHKSLEGILMASNVVYSLDNKGKNGDEKSFIDTYHDSSKTESHENDIIENDIRNKLISSIGNLKIIEQKVVKLKGFIKE